MIYYSDVYTPIGKLCAAFSKKGLVMLNLQDEKDKFLQKIETQTKTTIRQIPNKVETLCEWLNDYFEGKNLPYTGPFDLRGTNFQLEVWNEIYKIPYGRLTSYGKIAKNIGKPKASRAVGNAVGANPISIIIPCHRVVSSNGGIGGFGGGLDRKRALLKIEGIFSTSNGTPEKSTDLCEFF
jgi:O-6-methylguanine DNA methyltransferase